jgi:hypothetical protein
LVQSGFLVDWSGYLGHTNGAGVGVDVHPTRSKKGQVTYSNEVEKLRLNGETGEEG